MIPRLWIVTDSEARQRIDSKPFKTVLAGLPPDDRMAVARLAIESWRRQRATGQGSKRSMAKCLANARRNYQEWRDERPDDYQLWRDVLKGDTQPRDADRPGATRTNTQDRNEDTMIDLTPTDCYGTLVVDANGTSQFLDILAEREHLRERITNAYEVRQRLEAVEKKTHKKLTPPLRIGTIYINADGRGDPTTIEWWDSLTLED